MRFDMLKSKAQKGAFLAFAALLLPFLFIFAGFVVDFGYAWAYKSKLQNAADAAALAGASHFANGDSYGEHPNADSYANQFLKANFGYLPNPIQNLKMQAQEATEKNSTTGEEETHGYYRVAFSEKVPVTFMKLFNYDGLDVRVEAVAIIPRKGTSTNGNFINIGNWIAGSAFDSNSSHFDPDGKIVIYNHEKYEEAIRKGQFNYFAEGNESEYEQALKKGNSDFDEMFSSISTVRSAAEYDIQVNGNTTDKLALESKDSNKLRIRLKCDNSRSNFEQPFYIYVKGNVSTIFIDIMDNITRPVIFCYTGHSSWSYGATNIQFDNHEHDFRGSIYTPYSQIIPFNFENGRFQGSITADAIALNSNHGYFKWESFGTPADIGGESGSGSQEDKSHLVINNKLQW